MKKSTLLAALTLTVFTLSGQSEADKLYQNNEFAQALPLFKQLSVENPGNYAYFEKYVLCLMQLQEADAAESAILERTKTDKNNPDLYFLYGSFLSRQGRSVEADSIRQLRRKLLDEGYGARQWDAAPPANATPTPPASATLPPPALDKAGDEPVKSDEADEMPLFLHPDCDRLTDTKEQKLCSDKKMLEFVYKNVQYPREARLNGAQGSAVITYVVEKDGSMTGLRIVRDPGFGMGEAALSVMQLLQAKGIVWKPGKQKGVPVRVQYNMPVKFQLN